MLSVAGAGVLAETTVSDKKRTRAVKASREMFVFTCLRVWRPRDKLRRRGFWQRRHGHLPKITNDYSPTADLLLPNEERSDTSLPLPSATYTHTKNSHTKSRVRPTDNLGRVERALLRLMEEVPSKMGLPVGGDLHARLERMVEDDVGGGV